MKHELAREAIRQVRNAGFSGSGSNRRIVGDGLQWVVQVERVPQVDQVNIEVGITFGTTPPADRRRCRILWSLANFPEVESDEVARALHAVAAFDLDERVELVRPALLTVATFAKSHASVTSVRQAYAEGLLGRAFIFPDARDILERQ